MPNAHTPLDALRKRMAEQALDAYFVPSADEHLNEYLPAWRARRQWLSGFTGSAGDLLVGLESAWLFTDARYHLQAESELQGTGIQLMRVGTPNVPTIREHLQDLARKRPGFCLGVDPMVLSVATAEGLRRDLTAAGGVCQSVSGNLVDPIWSTRPTPSRSCLLVAPPEWSGRTAGQKVQAIRDDLRTQGADGVAVVKLDQIAWLLNLRSRDDVPFNPVFEAFLYLDRDALHLFLRGAHSRLPDDRDPLPGLVVHDYGDYVPFLAGLRGSIFIDPSRTTAGVVEVLKDAGCTIISGLSPLEARKAVKNTAERAAMAQANLRASVAKTRAWIWLRREWTANSPVTETAFKDRLEALYAEQPDFTGLSFNTIAATGPHGAIVHYGSCDDTPLTDGDLFLIDSGAHIAGGTTDDTRTIAVGNPSAEARRLFTLVLKGHISAARQVLPEGSNGSALDALARAPLWNAGLNYDHGTGHGVGAWLCVHEGPFAISERGGRTFTGEALLDGMVSSIEPGYYRPGWGGIRLENLYLYEATDAPSSNRRFLRLRPLTWVPFDPALIDREGLSPEELSWLDQYHAGCIEKLAPLLPTEDLASLRDILG